MLRRSGGAEACRANEPAGTTVSSDRHAARFGRKLELHGSLLRAGACIWAGRRYVEASIGSPAPPRNQPESQLHCLGEDASAPSRQQRWHGPGSVVVTYGTFTSPPSGLSLLWTLFGSRKSSAGGSGVSIGMPNQNCIAIPTSRGFGNARVKSVRDRTTILSSNVGFSCQLKRN